MKLSMSFCWSFDDNFPVLIFCYVCLSLLLLILVSQAQTQQKIGKLFETQRMNFQFTRARLMIRCQFLVSSRVGKLRFINLLICISLFIQAFCPGYRSVFQVYLILSFGGPCLSSLSTGTLSLQIYFSQKNSNERSSCKVERLAIKRFKFHRQESFFLVYHVDSKVRPLVS